MTNNMMGKPSPWAHDLGSENLFGFIKVGIWYQQNIGVAHINIIAYIMQGR
jgi:hypothetical protein